MRTILSATLAMSMLVALTAIAGPPPADEAYRDGVRKWRQGREARLQADGGWLTVVGLFWLKQGENRFGTDGACDIVLPAGSTAPVAGTFTLAGGRTSVRLEAGVSGTIDSRAVSGATPLRSDASGPPEVLELGRLSLHVIERGGRYAIRLKDRESALRKAFTGLKWFEPDASYRIVAHWVAYPEPKLLRVPNVLGRTEPMPSPGYAEFQLGATPVRLDGVLEEPEAQELFFIFKDATSGHETYGAGRFLYAALPKDGQLTLDFNKAYNPPCAFTPYATCPLPPPQNELAVRVEAGEKAYGAPH